MSELAAIAGALGARQTSASRGVILTVPHGDRWFTMFGRERPHLELAMDAPDLTGLTLTLHLGRETLLGDDRPDAARARDPRWRLDQARTPQVHELLDEPPWPLRAPALWSRTRLIERVLPAVVVGVFGWLGALAYTAVGASDAFGGDDPTPRYVLTVEDGRARIERRTSEVDGELAIGAARRLLQLVTRPARRRDAPPPAPAPPATGNPYR